MNDETYVYIFKCGEFMKVGIARSPKRRMDDIQAANPNDVLIIDQFKFCDRVSASVAERFAHSALKDAGAHKKLEWFHLNKEYLGIAKSSILEIQGGNHLQMQDEIHKLKKRIKKLKGAKVADACEYMESLGHYTEAKIIRRSHSGPYCSFLVNPEAVSALSAYVEREGL